MFLAVAGSNCGTGTGRETGAGAAGGPDASGELSDGAAPADVAAGPEPDGASDGNELDGTPPDALAPDTGAPPGSRKRLQLQSWKFLASDSLTGAEAPAFDDSAWAAVSVPHTWDSVTLVTKHAHSWYRTHVAVATEDAQKRFFVSFEGAFQVADVFVNGQHLGQHRGGFTQFVFDASPAVQVGDNVVAVQVSNDDCADCLPDSNARLYKGYGGIYRKAWWTTTSRYHVATTDYASSGIYVTPSGVSAASANVSADVLLTNDGPADETFTVKSVLCDAMGNAVLTSQTDVVVKAGTTAKVTPTGMVSAPHLWGPGNPYLYTFVATVTVGGVVRDIVSEPIGFRSYQLTTTDFTLNGVSTRLRGMAKHQETEYSADAVSDAELTADWDAIQDLGLNYMRLVHYPHAQLEYDLADQRGIMVWAENGHTNSGAPTPNGDNINREMVHQNWNHPSIIFWSAGNEAGGVTATSEYAAVLKAADPSRPVVYASNGQTPANVDLLFHNSYAGWYGGSMYDFLTSGDHWVSETGAGSSIATHTADSFAMKHTVDSFEPEEYGALVNEVRFDDLLRNPSHVPAYSGWAFRDISDVKYKGLLNTKGLITFAGYKKDIFYHFKSLLRTSPVVHLVGRQYFLRSADGSGHGAIKAYSNAAKLTLSINGTLVGTESNDSYKHPNGTPIHDVFLWADALVLGKNVVKIDDGAGNTDTMTVYYRGGGTTLPADPGAKVTNLTASNGPAYFIDAPVGDQLPFYFDFDGTGDNTFDVVPAPAAGASWVATRRQSDTAKRTDLAFDLPSGADVFVLASKQAAVPGWISGGGFTDTGTPCRWRDNSPRLVDCSLYKRTLGAGAHVSLATTNIDYVVLVK
jgi:beta-galactosidase